MDWLPNQDCDIGMILNIRHLLMLPNQRSLSIDLILSQKTEITYQSLYQLPHPQFIYPTLISAPANFSFNLFHA